MQEEKLRKGPWFKQEDEGLAATIAVMGERRWDSIAKASGLRRSGKSCRLRWLNYLRPNLKRGRLSADEERIVLQLHEQWGNKWSKIAQRLPGRTDNEIKNYWRSHLRKKGQDQEQGDKNIMNDGKPEILIPKGEKTDFISNNGDCASLNHDPFRTSDDSFGLCGLSSYAIVSSPYENRLLDWIPGWSDDQSGLKNHGDCSDSGFFYPVWNSENSDNGLWESSGFLWQTD